MSSSLAATDVRPVVEHLTPPKTIFRVRAGAPQGDLFSQALADGAELLYEGPDADKARETFHAQRIALLQATAPRLVLLEDDLGVLDSAAAGSPAAEHLVPELELPPVPSLPPVRAFCSICGAALPEGGPCTPLCELAGELDRRADAAAAQAGQTTDTRRRHLYLGKEEGLRDGAKEAGRRARRARGVGHA
jgi:hypothetical protein